MDFIDKLKHNNDNPFAISKIFLKLLGVLVTDYSLREGLENHSDFPSLLCVKDVFATFGVKTIAVKTVQYSLSDFETPFICPIQKKGWATSSFTLIKSIDNDLVTFYNPVKLSWEIVALKIFIEWSTGTILLAEKSEFAGEKDYKKRKKIDRINRISKELLPVIIFAPVLFSLIYAFRYFDFSSVWHSSSLLVFNMTGTIISALLIWYDIDSHNPVLKEICSGSQQMDCNAVLKAEGSKIFGISWSVIGFTYFFTNILSIVLFGPFNIYYLTVWSILSILVSPYILYSVIYQWKVVKKWCILCLGTQAILFFQLLLGVHYLYTTDNSVNHDLIYPVFSQLTFFALVLAAAISFLSIIKKWKEGKVYQLNWQQLKSDPEIFNSLLTRQQAITVPFNGIGLVIGNPNALHEIIKVSDPYCEPCSKAHSELDYILKQHYNVKLRIIFTATVDDRDIRRHPVRHLMAIHEIGDQKVMKKALDDWYLNPNKDYQNFANNYPVNETINLQDNKIKIMSNWCHEMGVSATPTIYFDGYLLPENYTINEIKYFL